MTNVDKVARSGLLKLEAEIMADLERQPSRHDRLALQAELKIVRRLLEEVNARLETARQS